MKSRGYSFLFSLEAIPKSGSGSRRRFSKVSEKNSHLPLGVENFPSALGRQSVGVLSLAHPVFLESQK